MTFNVQLAGKKNTDYDCLIHNSNNPKWCAANSLFTVDGISFFLIYDINNIPYVFSVNTNRPQNKVLFRLSDNQIIQNSMSDYSMNRFKKAYTINKDILTQKARRNAKHA